MVINMFAAKEMAFARFKKELEFLNTRPKCKDYGQNETAESLWKKLPQASKEYWLS